MPGVYRAHLSYALCAKSHLSVANSNIDHISSAQRCCNGRRKGGCSYKFQLHWICIYAPKETGAWCRFIL